MAGGGRRLSHAEALKRALAAAPFWNDRKGQSDSGLGWLKPGRRPVLSLLRLAAIYSKRGDETLDDRA